MFQLKMALDGYYLSRLEEALNKGKVKEKIVIEFLANNIYPIYQTTCKEAQITENDRIRLFYSSSQTLPKCTPFGKTKN